MTRSGRSIWGVSLRSLIVYTTTVLAVGILIGMGYSFLINKVAIKPTTTVQFKPSKDGFSFIPTEELVPNSGIKYNVKMTNNFVLGTEGGQDKKAYLGGENFLAIRIFTPISEEKQKRIKERILPEKIEDRVPGVLDVQHGEYGFAVKIIPVDTDNDRATIWQAVFNKIKSIMIEELVPKQGRNGGGSREPPISFLFTK